MRCSKVEKLLSLKLDNELGEARSQKLSAHLDGCSKCKALASDYQLLDQKLRTSEPVEFPGWIHHRILDNIKTHEAKRNSYHRRWRLQAIPATMAILASIYMGVLVGNVAFMPETESSASTESVSLEVSSLLYYENGDTHE